MGQVRRRRLLGACSLALLLAVVAAARTVPPQSATEPAASPSTSNAEPSPVSPARLVRSSPERPATRSVEGLRMEVHTTYALDPTESLVRVRVSAKLTNQSPDVIRGGYVMSRYFPEWAVLVVAEATNLAAAKDDGTPLSVRRETVESPFFQAAIVDLVPNLTYPNSQSVTLTYDIPSLPPRSGGLTRINPAFATFPVFTDGDPGLATVEVVVPERFEVEIIGGELGVTEAEGAQVFSSGPIDDPPSFQLDVVARDDEKLVRRAIDLPESTVEVQAWPGDEEWADLVAAAVTDGIPVLERLVGTEWPASRDLVIVETVAPYLYGYAGWYEPSSSLIEVGDALDNEVVMHELSHIWLNDSYFGERWISEGLADTLTALTLDELGHESTPPEPVAADDPGRLLLNEWGDPDLERGDSADLERYGYNTSYFVVSSVTAEIGPERLTELVAIALARELPYRAEVVPGVLTSRTGWKQVLDLFENVGASTTAEALFRELVLTEDEAALLGERSEARAAYAALEEAAAGWGPPLAVRKAMSQWDFDGAVELIDRAHGAVAVRDEIVDVLDQVEVEVPAPLHEAFEGSLDLDDLDEELDAALAASQELRAAVEADRGGVGPLGWVGLLGADVDEDLDRAHAALADGAWPRAERAAASVVAAYDGATSTGLVRIGAALGIVLVLAVLLRKGLSWRRGTQAPPPLSDDELERLWGPKPAEPAAQESAAEEPDPDRGPAPAPRE